MSKVLISTTGKTPIVTINDLGRRKIVHPTVDLDLTAEYKVDKIQRSKDLQQAIENGDLTFSVGDRDSAPDSPITSLVNNASQIIYNPSEPANWIGAIDLVSKGLDELAARELASTSGDLSSQIADLNAALTNLETSVETLSINFTNQSGELLTISQDIEGINLELIDVNNDLVSVNDDLIEINTSITNFNQRFTNLNSFDIAFTSTSGNWNTNPTNLFTALQELDSRINEIFLTVNGTETDIININAEITDINQDLVGINSDLISLDSRLDGHDSELLTINQDLVDINSDLITLDSRIDTHDGQFTSINQELVGINQDLVDINSDIALVDQRIDDLITGEIGYLGAENIMFSTTSGFYSSTEMDAQQALNEIGARLDIYPNRIDLGSFPDAQFRSFDAIIAYANANATAEQPIQIDIHPGVFEFTNPITISAHIQINGSDPDKTFLRPLNNNQSGIILAGDESELNNLAILGNATLKTTPNVVAIHINDDLDVEIQDVDIISWNLGITYNDSSNNIPDLESVNISNCAIGIRTIQNARLRLQNVELKDNDSALEMYGQSVIEGDFVRFSALSLVGSGAAGLKTFQNSYFNIRNSSFEFVDYGVMAYDFSVVSLNTVDFLYNFSAAITQRNFAQIIQLGSVGDNVVDAEDPTKIHGIIFEVHNDQIINRVLGEFVVGSPTRGTTTYLGGGKNSSRGVLVYTQDQDGNFADVSHLATDFSDTTFSFPNLSVDNSIYFGCSVMGGQDYLKFSGIRVSLTNDGLIQYGLGELVWEYWGSDNWVEFKIMATNDEPPYITNGDKPFQVLHENIRFSNEFKIIWYKNDPMGLGTDYYWVRCRIATEILKSPEIQEISLHGNYSKINKNGWIEFYGEAKPLQTLPIHLNNFQSSGDAATASTSYLSKTFNFYRSQNRFGENNFAQITSNFYLPYNLDSSEPLVIEWAYKCADSNEGNISWIVRCAFTNEISEIYPDTTSAPGAYPTERSFSHITSTPGNHLYQKNTGFVLDVSELKTRSSGSWATNKQGDILWISIQRNPNDITDTYTNAVDILQVNVIYTAWCLGGQVNLSLPPKKSLWVVGDKDNLTVDEDQAISSTREVGYDCTVLNDWESSAEAAQGQDCVIITHTVNPNNVLGKFRDVTCSVAVLHPAIFQDMNMTGSVQGTNWGTYNDYLIHVTDTIHPITWGFNGYTLPAFPSIRDISWGNITGTEALSLIANPNNLDQSCLFLYSKGALGVNDFVMPAKRFGVGWLYINWYDLTWGRRVPITIPAAQVAGVVNDYPVYLDLTLMPQDFWDNVQATSNDIRMTTGNGFSEIPFEIVSFDPLTKTGYLYFKSDLTNSQDNQFYLYYKQPTAAAHSPRDKYGAYRVWSDSFVAVWHMHQSSIQIVDSTGNGNSLRAVGGASFNHPGKFGKAIGLNIDGGDDDLFYSPGNVNFNYSAPFSIDLWSRQTQERVQSRLIQRPKTSTIALIGETVDAAWSMELKSGWQPGRYRIIAKHSGQSMQGTSSKRGNVFQTTPSTTNTLQKWDIIATGDGYYYFSCVGANGRCAYPDRAGTADGVSITVDYYFGGVEQMYQIEQVEEGYYRFVNRLSGKVMEVAGGSTALNGNVQQMGYTGADHQKWQLIRDDGQPSPNNISFRKVSTVNSPNSEALNVWNHYAVDFNTTTGATTLRSNSAIVGTGTLSTGLDSGEWPVVFGGGFNNYSGYLDEVRIHKVQRNDAWWTTQWNNQNNPAAFTMIGTEEYLEYAAQPELFLQLGILWAFNQL